MYLKEINYSIRFLTYYYLVIVFIINCCQIISTKNKKEIKMKWLEKNQMNLPLTKNNKINPIFLIQ